MASSLGNWAKSSSIRASSSAIASSVLPVFSPAPKARGGVDVGNPLQGDVGVDFRGGAGVLGGDVAGLGHGSFQEAEERS